MTEQKCKRCKHLQLKQVVPDQFLNRLSLEAASGKHQLVKPEAANGNNPHNDGPASLSKRGGDHGKVAHLLSTNLRQ
jgi:hypothetical protein